MMSDVLRDLARRLVPRSIRNVARSPRSTFAWASHELEYRFGIRRHCTIADGWTVRCHPAAAHAFRSHLEDHEFQRELAGFRAHSRPAMRLIDVGAHYGVFTLAALHYGPEARVVAVDPSPVAIRVMRANVALSGSADRVEIVEAAVGARMGTLPMLSTGPGSTHYMIFADSTRPDTSPIALTTLDALSARFPDGPTHVKADVEGFEEEVIRGGAAVLARLRPVVHLELHGAMIRERGGDPRAPLNLLADLGYRRLESSGSTVTAAWAATQDLVRLVCLPD